MRIDRRALLAGVACAAALPALPARLRAAGPSLRVGSLKFGSLSWLIETARAEKLPEKAGLDLIVSDTASTAAARIGLLAGDVDLVVSDWPWAMRQRSEGEPLKFAPYSSALGGVMVPEGGGIRTVVDLKGKRLGIAGTSIDKSWVLFRAYCRKVHGFDVAAECRTIFGAAPLITEQIRQGRIDAALNFWTFSARLAGTGYVELISMADVIKGLGIEPAPPLIGYIWSERIEAQKAGEIGKFLSVMAEANEILKTSDAAWERARQMMRAESEAEFLALRDYYRSGIPSGWSPELTAASGQLLALLIELGEEQLVGSKTKFDEKLFHGA